MGIFTTNQGPLISHEEGSFIRFENYSQNDLNTYLREIVYQTKVYDGREMTDIVEITLSGHSRVICKVAFPIKIKLRKLPFLHFRLTNTLANSVTIVTKVL